MDDIRKDRIALFANLARTETQPEFWECVAENVDCTVEDTPVAYRYDSEAEFRAATFTRLQRVLVGGATLEVQHLYVDGDTTIAELLSTSKTSEGATFVNRYCWICRFDGDMIVQVRAYLDSAMVSYAVVRNEPRRRLARSSPAARVLATASTQS